MLLMGMQSKALKSLLIVAGFTVAQTWNHPSVH